MTLFAKRQTAAQLRVDRFLLDHLLNRQFKVTGTRVNGRNLYQLSEYTGHVHTYPVTDPMPARELAQWLDGAKWAARHPKKVNA